MPKAGLPTDRAFVDYIESWAKVTLSFLLEWTLHIKKNIVQIQAHFPELCQCCTFFFYSIDEGFIDLTSSLNSFIPDRTVTRKDKLDMISGVSERDIWRRQGIYSVDAHGAIPYWPSTLQ